MDRLRQALRARRLVVKVGSSLLVDAEGGVRKPGSTASPATSPACAHASSRW